MNNILLVQLLTEQSMKNSNLAYGIGQTVLVSESKDRNYDKLNHLIVINKEYPVSKAMSWSKLKSLQAPIWALR